MTFTEQALAETIEFKGDVEALKSEASQLLDARNNLLPIEQDALTTINRRLTEVDLLLRQASFGLPFLSTEIFSWTRPQKAGWNLSGGPQLTVPVFAYISANAHSFELTVERFIPDRIVPPLPGVVASHYYAIIRGLHNYLGSRRDRISLTYRYAGGVPTYVKDLIEDERDKVDGQFKRFDDIGFICEVDRWQLQTEQTPRQFLDPILVGIKGTDMMVLTSFDPTPVEKYVLDEFVRKENA